MQIEWHDSAILDLKRLKEFIQPYNFEASQRAIRLIRATVSHIKSNPRMGKPVEGLPDYHELIIPFGASGYVLRYRIQGNTAIILAVKHSKEAGFSDKVSTLWVVKDPVEEAYGMLADGGSSAAEELLKDRQWDSLKEEQRIAGSSVAGFTANDEESRLKSAVVQGLREIEDGREICLADVKQILKTP